MTDLSPLQRKIGTRKKETPPPSMTVARVWRRAISHGLTRSIGLETRLGEVSCSAVTPDAIPARIAPGAFTALLDGPYGYGLAIVSRDIVAAMLEIQTLGRVQTRALPERAVTATDAAMMADPLDRVLAAQETLVPELPEDTMAGGYRYATRVENLVEIGLTLEEAEHDLYSIPIEAGPGGPRHGTLEIILPRRPEEVDEPEEAHDWSEQIEARVLGADVVLRAELARLSLSVGEVEALQPGSTLTLGRHTMEAVRLVAQGDHPLCVGRLGQSSGRKAVRIGETVAEFSEANLPRTAGDAHAGGGLPAAGFDGGGFDAGGFDGGEFDGGGFDGGSFSPEGQDGEADEEFAPGAPMDFSFET